jgi:hypothetical protein
MNGHPKTVQRSSRRIRWLIARTLRRHLVEEWGLCSPRRNP